MAEQVVMRLTAMEQMDQAAESRADRCGSMGGKGRHGRHRRLDRNHSNFSHVSVLSRSSTQLSDPRFSAASEDMQLPQFEELPSFVSRRPTLEAVTENTFATASITNAPTIKSETEEVASEGDDIPSAAETSAFNQSGALKRNRLRNKIAFSEEDLRSRKSGDLSRSLLKNAAASPFTSQSLWKSSMMKINAVKGVKQAAVLAQAKQGTAFELVELMAQFSEIRREEKLLKQSEAGPQWKRALTKTKQGLKWVNSKIPILDPDKWKRRAWDCIIFVLVIYSAVMVPLEIGFHFEQSSGFIGVGIAVDMIFTIDILLNFRTAYLEPHGQMIINPQKIAWHYMKGWFVIDCLASLPIELIIILAGFEPGDQVAALAILKAPRLLRLGRLMRFFEHNAAMIIRNANIVSITRLLGAMCLLAHWNACLWHFLAQQFRSYSWTFDELEEEGLEVSRYLWGYWIAVSVMVGETITPQNNIEALLCIFNLILGACFMAVVVGNMAILVSNVNATNHRIRAHKDRVGDAARYLGAPSDVQKRIQEYYDYMAGLRHPGSEMLDTIALLPPGLYNDVCDAIISRGICKIAPFDVCEDAAILYMVQRMSIIVSMPGEVVYREGDIAEEVYIIHRGKIAFTKEGEITGMQQEGGWFGKEALLKKVFRTEAAMSVIPSDLLELYNGYVREAMEQYPESGKKIQDWATLSRIRSSLDIARPAFE